MARADYIWIVLDGAHIVRAFTVKHELITWLRSQVEDDAAAGTYLEIHRARDGGHHGEPLFMGFARELIEEADRG